MSAAKLYDRAMARIALGRPSGVHTYRVNEIVRSIQGEGHWIGCPTTFLRFSDCDLSCSFCDTDHRPGSYMTVAQIVARVGKLGADVVSLCGGEPTLQVDTALLSALKDAGCFLTIETHGGNPVHEMVDWVVVSPKISSARVREVFAGRKINELKYVVRQGQRLPEDPPNADHYFVSAIYDGDSRNQKNINWAAWLVMTSANNHETPWRLTLQAHKSWRII